MPVRAITKNYSFSPRDAQANYGDNILGTVLNFV